MVKTFKFVTKRKKDNEREMKKRYRRKRTRGRYANE
jgi:hypothetical protein